MAAVSINIGQIIQEIRSIAVDIRDTQKAEKESRKAAQLLVYKALAIHPALEYMRPPTGVLGDVDWYTELRSSFNKGIFRRLGQNEHFKRTSVLGETGTRARVMMLLLWILGHRLSDDQVGKLISTAIGDALPKDDSGALLDELHRLDSVKRVLVDLRRMIKTKLPLPPDRNPFLGKDYRAEDEDKALPRGELWGYNLPPEEQYEYDAHRNPSILLRRLESRVIIPQNKLTLLLIQWATSNFGLGKKVYSRGDIDPSALWNADPPFIDEEDAAGPSPPTSEWAFEIFDGVDPPPHDYPFQDLPADEFLHVRYCHTYRVHGWVHDSLCRILLFNALCGAQQLPPHADATAAVHVARRLASRLGEDIVKYMEPFIVDGALTEWRNAETSSQWAPQFETWSEAERGMTAIFYDAAKLDFDVDYPRAVTTMRHFLIDPLSYCPDAADILALPLMSQHPARAPPSNTLPPLDPAACTCGECALVESRISRDLDAFGHEYASIIDGAAARGCAALARAWEPVLRAAEEWQEALLGRIATDFAAFPWTYDRRAGPAVLGIANKMRVAVGTHLSVQDLLRFAVALGTTKLDGDGRLFVTAVVMRPLPPGGLGYISTTPFAEDREPYRNDGDRMDYVIYAGGGWLDELAGSEVTDADGGIMLLHSTDQLSIEYYSLNPAAANALCMPLPTPDFASHLPPAHDAENSTVVAARSAGSAGGEITYRKSIVASNLKSDGFPLLSVLDPGFPSTRGALAALVRVTLCDGRVVESAWKPAVALGAECEHRAAHGRMACCAPTAADLLRAVARPDDALAAALERNRWDWDFLAETEAADKRCRAALRARREEWQRRTARLRGRGCPLERHRACIVRCEADDGPAEPIVVLAASLGKKVYVIHHRECWACALAGMRALGCTVGIAKNTKVVTCCDDCGGA